MKHIRLRAHAFMMYAAVALLTAAAGACSSGGTEPGQGGVETVRVTPTAPSVAVGDTLQLLAAGLDASQEELTGREAVWASADSSVASVTNDGRVTARKLGSVQVQAVIEGKSAFAFVTVVPRPVASVTVAPATASVAAGATVQLQAAVADDRGAAVTTQPVIWRSSNDAIARVTSAGLVIGVAPGSATITAVAEGTTVTSTSTVLVTAAPPGAGPALAADFVFGCTNLICAFTDRSTAPGGSVSSWSWEFGNGGTPEPNTNSDVTYRAAGTYTVKLTITDDRGATSSTAKTLTVRATPPVRLVNRATGRCLSLRVGVGAFPAQSTPLVTRPCDGRPDQRYVLPSGQGVGPLLLSDYSIPNDPRYNDGVVVQLLETAQNPLHSYHWIGSQNQRWLYTAGEQLRDYVRNSCITDRGNGEVASTDVCGGGDAQRWEARP